MNKNIIVILIIIIIAIVGVFALTQHAKADTQINFLTQSNLKNGDQVQFELRDAQGNILANQEITISFTGNNNVENYSITTDSQGKGGLLINNEDVGSYNITVTYNGDEDHNGCIASQTVTIEEGTSENPQPTTESTVSSQSTNSSSSSSDSSSSSSSNLYYDSELNVNYDSNGKIVGGQNDGADYEELKNNPPEIDEDGNLI